MDCSLPGSSVHGLFQARVLEWVALAFSERGNITQAYNSGYSLNPSKLLYFFHLLSEHDEWILSRSPFIQGLQNHPFYSLDCVWRMLRAHYIKYRQKTQKLPMKLMDMTFFIMTIFPCFTWKNCFWLLIENCICSIKSIIPFK